MAEAVLFNVAESILKKLGSLALNEFWLLWGLQDDIEKLKNTVETISAVLLDAESQYLIRNEVRVWLDSLKDVLYDADDLLDDISTEELRRHLRSRLVTNKVKLRFSWSNWGAYGPKLAHKIQDVRAKLEGIVENKKLHLNPNIVQPTVIDHDRDTHSTAPNVIIGREDDKKEIIIRLLGNQEQNVMVLPIVGLGGLGKTALAQIVYDDEIVKANFDLRAWVCVSDIFDIKSIVGKMIQRIDSGAPVTNLDMEQLKIEFYKRVERKKYLIVLDDVWNEEREKWVQFCDFIIGSGSSGIRIIVTTRSQVVADITRTSLTYVLKGLSKKESWDLFRGEAFKQGEAPNEEFEKMGQEITAKCGGLPLAIRTIGSLLYIKTKDSEWLHFKDVEFAKLDPKVDIVKTLKLSYNHLPSNLKHCFAYCSLFPKDFMFDEDTLIKSWRAQGYISSENEGTSFQVSGLDCLKYLVQRSFLQMEHEVEFGKGVVYKMHDFMHDLATSVAGVEVKLIHGNEPNGNEKSVTGKTRHISLYEVPYDVKWKVVAPLLYAKKARTLIVTSRIQECIVGKEVLNVFAELKYLRVLKIPYCQFKILPNFICKLKHLRELDLSWNQVIRMLPDSVTELCNLEALNLDYCRSLKKLPKNIMKLVKLIHLGLEECFNLEEMPQGIGLLISLEVLSRFSLSQKRWRHATGGLYLLQNLSKLKGELMITNLQYLKRGAEECEAANLKGKPNLARLILDWGKNELAGSEVNIEENIEEKSLEALEPHINLRELKLVNYGGISFPRWMLSLKNLVELWISSCGICKSLPPLYGLPSLQLLDLRDLDGLEYMMDGNGSTKGSGMPCFFPVLKNLSIDRCPKLKGWWSVTSPAAEPLQYQMPCLSDLFIWDCPKLEGWMPRLPSIKTVTLWNTGLGLLEETLKQSKPLSTGTSCGTTISSLDSLTVGQIEDLEILEEEEVLRSLASLKSLAILALKDAKFLSIWAHYLTSLESLSFQNVKEMNLLEENNSELIQCLNNLRSLSIIFYTYMCSEMKALPEWIQHLTSLETLEIRSCEELESLPLAMGSLTSLNSLVIVGCPLLRERCGSNQGEDWPAISHIPNIRVEWEWVQRDGR